MRAILLLSTSLIFVVAVFAAGMAFTAYLIAEPEPHKFAHLDTPDLWTSKPVQVKDSEKQYQRIAAAPAVASLPPSNPAPRDMMADAAVRQDGASPPVDGLDMTQTASVSDDVTTEEGGSPAATLDPAHAEWCFSRYRSYRVDDNSYQPFGGGGRRQCESPWSPMPEDTAAISAPGGERNDLDRPVAEQASLVSGSGVGSHEEWCLERYRSYRVEDDTYQPFDGGPRRLCASPYR